MKKLKFDVFVIGCLLACIDCHVWATEPVLTFGETVTGTISAAAQTNSYTFSANTGDVIDITMTTTSGYLHPKIQLLTSNGTQVAIVYNPYCNSGPQEMDTVKLPASPNGVYIVSVSDCGDTNTGTYALYLQRTNKPGVPVPISPGQTLTGTIGLSAQNNTYTFSASANDVFDFTMTTTAGYLNPKIRLYEPGGTLLSTVNNPYCNSGPQEMDTVKLPVAGVYVLLVADCGDTNTGKYALYAQSTNNPKQCSALLWGQTQVGTISSAAQNNCYTFSGTANDVMDLTMTSTSGYLNPKIRLYQPAGTLLTYANNPYCNSGPQQLNSVKLPSTGNYTVLLGDCGDANTGTYDISTLCFGVCLLPAPVLISLSPNSAPAGSAGLKLTLSGANFVDVESNSVVEWVKTSTDLSTTFVSTTELQATLPGTDLRTPGLYPVRVFTPAPGGGYSNELNFTVLGPVISSLSPASVIAGGPAFTLTVNGTTLLIGSVVKWNGTSLPTTYKSNTQLLASVPATDIATAGVFNLTVTNSLGISAPFPFTVDNPVPVLASLSPSSIIAGGSGFPLTVNGTGFVKASKVNWNGTALTTTYVSATQLQAMIPSADILDGDISVTVYNPSPGGGTSDTKTLAIDNPVPVLMSLSPASVTHGSAGFMLTANGFDFNEGAKVLWNGTPLATTFVSDTQLLATIPAPDLTAAGKATVTVANPAPSPSASNPITFTIN